MESTRALTWPGVRPRTPVSGHPQQQETRTRPAEDSTRGRVELRAGRARSPKTIHLLLLLAVTLIAHGQTFRTLHTFTAISGAYPSPPINSDGAGPNGLILSGSTLYGTAVIGGSAGGGTVFAVNTDGTGFANLNSFEAFPPDPGPYNNSGGAHPFAGLILSGNTLYGTAADSGGFARGTVFAVNTNGTGFTTLYDFTGGDDGYHPDGGVILSGNTLYGTANNGGSAPFPEGNGTVFALNTDGTGFTILHSFTWASGDPGINSDGAFPYAGLILSGNTLYGTARLGGRFGFGTVFALNPDGTGFTTLHSFTGSDGAGPEDSLILSGNTLYGTAQPKYGSSSGGTVFSLNINGTGFTILHRFTATRTNPSGANTNGDGFYPHGLVVSGNTLYGTAGQGGINGNGTLFAVSTNGTGFTTLYSFTATSTNSSGAYTNSDGVGPTAGLILSGNTLYGTASGGGSSGTGTLFSLSLPVSPPRLTINPSGANLTLTWPANAAGFTLQSTTNLIAQAVWTTVSPRPIQTGDQEVVTLDITSNNQFFRLRK